jgi:protein-S-isoprenylcysteine O-methyltransferase Ste14
LLKVAAYVAYLAALTLIAIAALLAAIRAPKSPGSITLQGTLGTFLQIGAAGILTRSMPSGPLHPEIWEQLAILILSPVSAFLFVWAQGAAMRSTAALVTDGPYAHLRHPMYLAFLGMLIATGLALSARGPLLAAIAIYIFGTELRVSLEESELPGYAAYRQQARWRYLPGLR